MAAPCSLVGSGSISAETGAVCSGSGAFLFFWFTRARNFAVFSSGRRQRWIVAGPGACPNLRFALELRAHALHLGIEIVEIVQHERFRKHGQLGRAEFVLAVMADDEVLDQGLELSRESRAPCGSLACSISSSMIMCPSNWPRVVYENERL